MRLLKKEQLALDEFKYKIKKKLGEQLVKIILFGSKARGEARPDSDIDVLIIIKRESEKVRDNIVDIKMNINLKYNLFVSPVVYSKKEYNYYKSIPTIFIQNVYYDAIKLYEQRI